MPEFALLIGPNGAGKSHFLQGIESGAIHCDVLGPISPLQVPPRPLGAHVPGVRLLRNDDPAPEGLTVGLKTEPNQLFQTGPLAAFTSQQALDLANIRVQLLGPLEGDLAEALGGPLSEVADSSVSALRMPYDELLAAARAKGLTVNEEKVLQLFQKVDGEAEKTSMSQGGVETVRRARLIAKKLQRPVIALSDEQVTLAGSWGAFGLFDTHFVRVFLEYRDKRFLNAFQRAAGGDQARHALSDDEFERRWGQPPWERVSEALASFHLPYRVKEPSTHPQQEVYFRLERSDGVPIEFGNLSAGEKVLIRFALSAFQVDEARVNVTVPKLLLLDEVDASLHPQNVHRLLGAIESGFVDSMGVAVIMSTHSPTTVALAPEGAIFEITETDRVPRSVTKQQALNRLTVGLPMLSIDYSGRRQVFVESSVDAAQYDRLANILKGELDLPRTLTFISAGGSGGGDSRGGCTVVTRIVDELTKNGIQSLFGIVDWDGKNESKGRVRVLSHGTHYTKENLLLDPLLVGILLLLDKPTGIEFPITIPEIERASTSELQRLSDVVLNSLSLPGSGTPNHYLGGFSLEVPISYQRMKGHELEVKLITAFPSLNRYSGSGKWLVDPIIDRVLSDFPRLCPQPIVDLFRQIATELPD